MKQNQVKALRKRSPAIVTLLLVSEDQRRLASLEGYLSEEEGFRPLVVTSGEEAARLLAAGEARVLLLDLVSRRADAAELCRLARRANPDQPVQILLIGGPDALRDPGALLALGADDFLVEPLSPDELRLRLQAALRRAAPLRRGRPDRGGAPVEARGLRAENLRLRQRLEATRIRLGELERSNEELQQLASTDALTGLFNRRSLFQRMEMEIDRALRFNLALCGILMDIDDFKAINDRFGHPCGDRVLHEIGEKLTHNLRKYDFAGRYGGEEFFIILPNTQARTGLRIAERFRSELDKNVFPCSAAQIHITLSLGVAQFQPNETREGWIARADAALYRAKQEGRNRTFLG